jgi:plastocyanin
MRKRVAVVVLSVGLISVLTMAFSIGSGVAIAQRSQTVQIIGADTFVPNALFQSTFQFAPGQTVLLKTGDHVVWRNTTEAPHTVSVLSQNLLATGVQDVIACAVCGRILGAHGFGGPNLAPVINRGPAGLETATTSATGPVGDSLFVAPGATVDAVINAPGGTTLRYQCAIHPWMQGSITVLNVPGL